MRCETRSGPFQCDYEKGHPGECETSEGPRARVTVDRDAQRELRRAVARVVHLEKALGEIRTVLALVDAGAPCGLALEDIRKVIAEVAHG